MARKGWSALSSDYRERLKRAGISQSDYESGRSIIKARGHAHTPERPTSYKPLPQYQGYQQKYNAALNAFEARKRTLYGAQPKWNPIRSRQNAIAEGLGMARMIELSGMNVREQQDEARKDPRVRKALGYH